MNVRLKKRKSNSIKSELIQIINKNHKNKRIIKKIYYSDMNTFLMKLKDFFLKTFFQKNKIVCCNELLKHILSMKLK